MVGLSLITSIYASRNYWSRFSNPSWFLFSMHCWVLGGIFFMQNRLSTCAPSVIYHEKWETLKSKLGGLIVIDTFLMKQSTICASQRNSILSCYSSMSYILERVRQPFEIGFWVVCIHINDNRFPDYKIKNDHCLIHKNTQNKRFLCASKYTCSIIH